MSPKGRGAIRRAAERVPPLAAITNRLKILGAPDDMIENLAWQWDTFDDEWTPTLQADLVTWSDDRLFREVTGILADFHDATTEADDPRVVQQLAARFASRSSIPEILTWVGEAPDARVDAALTAEKAGKMRGKLINALEAMRS